MTYIVASKVTILFSPWSPFKETFITHKKQRFWSAKVIYIWYSTAVKALYSQIYKWNQHGLWLTVGKKSGKGSLLSPLCTICISIDFRALLLLTTYSLHLSKAPVSHGHTQCSQSLSFYNAPQRGGWPARAIDSFLIMHHACISFCWGTHCSHILSFFPPCPSQREVFVWDLYICLVHWNIICKSTGLTK